MSALSSAISKTGHCHVRPRRDHLVASRIRSANDEPQPRQLLRHGRPSREATPVVKIGTSTATNLLGIHCWGRCLVPSPIAVWRGIAQDRRSTDNRPLDSRIKGARCAAVGCVTVQRFIVTFLAWANLADPNHLRSRDARQRRQRSSARGEMQRSTPGKFHVRHWYRLQGQR